MHELRQFAALTAVADTGSIARAAKQLGWSTPTVDYHLRALEQTVGSPVITRGARGSNLTPAGSVLAERARTILAMSERAVTEARVIAGGTASTLRFGVFPTGASRFLPAVTRGLAEHGIDVSATLDEVPRLATALQAGQLDAALVYATPGRLLPDEPSVQATPILSEPLFLALPNRHPLSHKDVITEAELATLVDEPWIMGTDVDDTLDQDILDVLRAHLPAEEEPHIAIRTDDYSVALAMVAARLALIMLPELALGVVPNGVVVRPVNIPKLSRELQLLTPSRPDSDTRASLTHLTATVLGAAETARRPEQAIYTP